MVSFFPLFICDETKKGHDATYSDFMRFIIFNQYTVLRKQARKLENDIDLKLVAYSKIGSSSLPLTSVDTAPLLGEHVFDSLSMEIEQMLDKVNMLNIFSDLTSVYTHII